MGRCQWEMAALPRCKGCVMEKFRTKWTAVCRLGKKIKAFTFKSETNPEEAYRIIQRVAAPDGYEVIALVKGDVTKKLYAVDLEKEELMLE